MGTYVDVAASRIHTPIHGMLSACGLLLDTPLTEEQETRRMSSENPATCSSKYSTTFWIYSRLASGTFSINADVVDITGIVTSMVRSERTTLRQGVPLELQLDRDLPKSAQGSLADAEKIPSG